LIQQIFPRIIPIIEVAIASPIAQAVILGHEESLITQLESIPEEVRKASKRIQVIKLERSRYTSKNHEEPEQTKERNRILREADETFSHYSDQIYQDINAQDQYGWTALHWAMAQHDVTSMLALLEAGADVTLRTTTTKYNRPYRNMAPLDIALYNAERATQDNNQKKLTHWQLVIGSLLELFQSRNNTSTFFHRETCTIRCVT
jgi:hypothetical protein